MRSVNELKKSFETLNSEVESAIKKEHKNLEDVTEHIITRWEELFEHPIEYSAAEELGKEYMAKHGIKIKQRGGAAPINYTMQPGTISSDVYGENYTQMGQDATILKNMDIYYNSAINRGCGYEDSLWPKLPTNMGMNQYPVSIGGSLEKPKQGNNRMKANNKMAKTHKKGRKSLKRNKRTLRKQKTNRKSTRNVRKSRRRQRGGSAWDTLSAGRFWNATIPANPIQRIGSELQNQPFPYDASPNYATWSYKTHGDPVLVDPRAVTRIDTSLNNFARPELFK
jgi:hypothetical protein